MRTFPSFHDLFLTRVVQYCEPQIFDIYVKTNLNIMAFHASTHRGRAPSGKKSILNVTVHGSSTWVLLTLIERYDKKNKGKKVIVYIIKY